MLQLNIQFVEGLQTTSKKFDYDMSVDFPSQFQEICKLFEIPEIRREKHALQLHSFSGEYIDTTSKITETTFGSESRVDVFLKLKPAIQAREIIEVIHDNDKVAQGKVLFKLKDTMQDPSFAEEFIENDGIAILSTFINRSKGNLQAYCLAGLRAALVYVSAMNVISDSPRIVGEIYNLTDTTQEYGLTIYKNALELLLVFVSYLENGLALVKEAAKESISKTKTKEPYENFMHLLRSGDLDVQVNTLAVMNIMLSKSKTEEKKKKLIFQWEKVELRPILKGLNESEYPAIKDQLHILQKISNYSIPRSWYESEKYKKEWERMTVKYEQTQEKLFEYQRQQPLIKLMRAELSRCHETLEMMSIQCGYLPKSYPTSRIGDRSGDLIAGEVIDLSMYDKMELELSSEYEMLQTTRRELVHRFMSNREFNNLMPSRKQSVVQRKQSIKPSDPFDSSDDEEEGKDERISPEIKLEMQKLRDKVKELQERLERQAHFVHEEDDYVPPPPPPDFDGDDFIPPMTGSQVTTEPATKTPTNQQIGSNKTTNITMTPEVSVSSPSSASSPPPPIIGGTVPSSSNGMVFGGIPPPPMGGNIPPPPPMNGSGIPPPISGMPLLSPITGSIPPPTPMAGIPPPSPIMGSSMPPLPPMMSGIPPPPPPMGGMSSPPPMSGMPPPPPPMMSGPPPPPMMGGMLPPPPMMSGPPPPPMMGGSMPPPPMMGGMPPPMMGGFRPGGFAGAGQPTKPKIIPQRKMKGLFWDRILTNTPQGAGTIWTGIKEGEFDMKEFESMFAKREAPPTAKRVEKKEVAPENAPLIDAKLFQNLSIMLRKLPKPAKLQQAILELDSKSLSKDQIDIIIQNMPTNEDMKEFKDKYKNKPMKNFTEAEKYMLMIITIPEFATRLDCWVFMHEFENNVSTMISPLDSMKKAIELIKNNKDFPYLLGYLLSMGNYLNGDTPKGQADGFHLKVLPKIDATKDKTNKISLLQYAIDTAVSSRPDLVNMSDDLKIVHEIKGTSLDSLTKGIGTIAAGFNKFKAQVKKVKEHVDDDDPFMKIATQFYNESRKKCDQIEQGLATVKKEYHALLKYYAYKDQEIEKTETTEFFGIISEFLLKFDKCIQATKAEQLKNQKKNQASQKKGQTITSAGKGEDAMSKMVNKIKSDLLNN